MISPEDKFRKLLAAYEDEVQRKQHKMGKRVDPTDDAQPNPNSGYCTFLRHGQQVIWSPSFDVIGTFDPATLYWTWGWADQTLDLRIRSRMDAVRKQGVSWGIDMLTNGLMTLETEHQAWELSIVATAVSSADAMYRMVETREGGQRVRFLALFDGPPPSRSTSIRVPTGRGDSGNLRAASSSSFPAVGARNTPFPGLASVSGNPIITGVPTSPSQKVPSNPALQRVPTNPILITRPTSNVPPKMASAPSTASPTGPEPTDATRLELGQRIFELMTTSQQGELGSVSLLARAMPPSGPVGSLSLDTRLILKPLNGPEETLTGSVALSDALIALWNRTRERNGAPYKFVTARIEATPQGLVTHVFLEL